MTVWVVSYLKSIGNARFWKLSKIFDTEEKAKEYCEAKNKLGYYHYEYDEEYVE